MHRGSLDVLAALDRSTSEKGTSDLLELSTFSSCEGGGKPVSCVEVSIVQFVDEIG